MVYTFTNQSKFKAVNRLIYDLFRKKKGKIKSNVFAQMALKGLKPIKQEWFNKYPASTALIITQKIMTVHLLVKYMYS